MADVRRSQLEGKSPDRGFHTEEIAAFLRSRKLEPASLILLDMMIPFKRQISALLSVAEPLSSLLFGQGKAAEILDFSRGEGSFEALKKALERGDE